jgi:hypothetical protein
MLKEGRLLKTALQLVRKEVRYKMIAEAAYHRAQKRGFQNGSPPDDWVAAEMEVDKKLILSLLSHIRQWERAHVIFYLLYDQGLKWDQLETKHRKQWIKDLLIAITDYGTDETKGAFPLYSKMEKYYRTTQFSYGEYQRLMRDLKTFLDHRYKAFIGLL